MRVLSVGVGTVPRAVYGRSKSSSRSVPRTTVAYASECTLLAVVVCSCAGKNRGHARVGADRV